MKTIWQGDRYSIDKDGQSCYWIVENENDVAIEYHGSLSVTLARVTEIFHDSQTESSINNPNHL